MNKAQRGVEKRQEKGNVRGLNKIASVLQPVSYTHLDVYKRQIWLFAFHRHFIGN